MKIIKKILIIVSLIAVAMTFASCDKCADEKVSAVNFNAVKETAINVLYDPQITAEGCEIISVKVVDEHNEEIETDENYKFTPTEYGIYFYKIEAEADGVKKVWTFKISVIDQDAPSVVKTNMPNDKKIEVGLYEGFGSDLDLIEVTDSNTKYIDLITKKVVKIRKGDKVYENSDGYESFYFNEIGSYEITVEITDISGKTAQCIYVVQTVDTTAPNLQISHVVYAWEKDGKVDLPIPTVSDVSGYNLTVSCNKGGVNKQIENGKVTATVGDELSVIYKATDEYNNIAIKTVTVKVLEKGEILDAEDDFGGLLFTENAVVESENGLRITTTSLSADIKTASGIFAVKNVGEFDYLELEVRNFNTNSVNLSLYISDDGKQVNIGKATLKNDTDNQTVAISVASLNGKKIDSIGFGINSERFSSFTVKSIKLVEFNDISVFSALSNCKVGEAFTLGEISMSGVQTAVEKYINICKDNTTIATHLENGGQFVFTGEGTYNIEYTVEAYGKVFTKVETVTVSGEKTPKDSVVLYSGDNVKNAINFENKSAFEYSKSFGGGFTENFDGDYVTSGKKSAKATVGQGALSGVIFGSPYKIEDSSNYITAKIYSEKFGNASFGVIIDGGIESKSPIVTLNKGWNEIGFFIDSASRRTYADKNITGIFVENCNGYDLTLFIDDVSFINKTAFMDGEIINSPNGNMEYNYGEDVVIIGVSTLGDGYISDYEVDIKKDSAVIKTVGVGEKINFLSDVELGEGEYVFAHRITDVLGGVHTIDESVKVQKLLTVSAKFQVYYANTEITLPDPTVTSTVLNGTELGKVVIKKYYKEENASLWQSADETIVIGNNSYFDVLYTATYSALNAKTTFTSRIYLRSPGTLFDFEVYDKGEYLGIVRNYNTVDDNIKHTPTTVWAHDGKYSCIAPLSTTWDSGPVIYLFDWDNSSKDETVYFDEPMDTVIFWAYAERDCTEYSLFVFEDGGIDWITAPIKILKGEHQYFTRLEKPITSLSKYSFGARKNETYYFDSISFASSAKIDYGTLKKDYSEDDEISIERPKVTEYSYEVFNQSQVDGYKNSVEIKGLDLNFSAKYSLDSVDKVNVKLQKGNYEIVYTTVIGNFTYTETKRINVHYFNVSFTEPDTGYYVKTEYDIVAPEGYNSGFVGKVLIKHESETEFTEQPVKDGIAKVTFNKLGAYQIKLYAEFNGHSEETLYNVRIRNNKTIADYEVGEAEVKYGEYFGIGLNYTKYGTITDDWSASGKYSYKVDRATAIDWMGGYYCKTSYPITSYISLPKSYSQISFVIKAENDMNNFTVCIGDKNRAFYYATVNVEKGVHTYTVTFKNDSGATAYFDTISYLGFKITPGVYEYYYIDDVVVYEEEIAGSPKDATVDDIDFK